ncbi:MAG: haloacid dehalogenase-like hydrolase [Oscillospiraceae bacterium]|jgi:phosphoserine phosphatase|nr:haloacid dehalogenase-like hydrolase [Oscillospiraceae bacterium]
MNVYDFDGTIFKGDSTAAFYNWCVHQHPRALALLPKQIWRLISLPRDCGITQVKEVLFAFLPLIPDMQKELRLFWNANEHRIYPWYLKQKRADDVIISASPRFLLEPICERLGVTLIASEVDPATGKCLCENCSKQNKPLRFREIFGNAAVEEFYSDSEGDLPMARLAERAYRVRRGRVYLWEHP